MKNKGAFWFFALATASSAALFAYLTYDTQRQVEVLTHADKLSDDVVAGKRVWEKYNCNDCHTILGFGGYYAPDMTKVYNRIGPDGIRSVVSNPGRAFASSWRKMPEQHLSEEEIAHIVAFFKWVGEIDNNDWPPQDSSQRFSRRALTLAAGAGMNVGAALFKEKGCISCHRIGGAGGGLGPALDGVGSKRDAETLERIIRDPQSVDPQATMPPQRGLTDAEIDALAHYLAEKK